MKPGVTEWRREGLRLFAAACVALGFALVAAAQKIEFAPVKREILEARLRDCPHQNSKRKQKLFDAFAEAGCSGERLTEQQVRSSSQPNVICTLPGETDDVILIGAHYDAHPRTYGIADNCSGAMLLPALYEGLATRPRKHTLVFAGFAAEEEGLLGSKAYAKSLSPGQREKTHAMVNLDTLGLSPAAVWLSQADPRLAEALAGVAESMKLSLNAIDLDKIGRTDSNSFIDIGVPTITIHSLTQETLGLLHTRWDQLDKIQWDDYFQTYNLVTVYLAYLDASWEAGQAAGITTGENTATTPKP